MMTLDEVKSEIERLAAILELPGSYYKWSLPAYGYSEGWLGTPHIEIDKRGYHYVSIERGAELNRVTTSDVDELLYTVFSAVASSLASSYELDNRIKGEDSRRQMFDYQVKTMGRLSPDWALRRKAEIDKTLQKYPYDDSSDARVCMVKDLVSRGYPQDQAWVLGCDRYPLPKAAAE